MPVVIQSRPDDEIADLIERVRSSKDRDVGLVIPPGTKGMQTPLNARLLSQFCRQSGTRTAIVSDDPRVQELARSSGFTVYASVFGYERGIEVLPTAARPRTAPTAWADTSVATAVKPPPTKVGGDGAAPPRLEARRTLTVPPPKPPRLRDRRRLLYFGGAAAGVIGLILFFTLAPSAKVTITVAALPLSVSPTIQGSTDANAAHQGDHILTGVVSATAANQFAASPTGQKTLPATPATGTLRLTATFPVETTVPAGTQFKTADQSITFAVTQDTFVCFGAPGSPPSGCMNNGQPAQPNALVPVQDVAAEATGNVPANTVTYWPPSERTGGCAPSFNNCTVTNPNAMSGGADQKQVTVASAQDLSGWNNQVQQIENQLTTQVNETMRTQSGGKSFAVDPSGSGKTIAFTVNPPLPNANDQFAAAQITVTVNAKAAVYDPNDVKNDVLADLQAQVPQGDQLASDKVSVQPASVTQAADDGTVVLSVTATGFAQPTLDRNGLKKQLAGKNPGDAQKIISNRIDHVQDVQVSEFPFTLFYLPWFSDRIEIDENFVPQPPTTPAQTPAASATP